MAPENSVFTARSGPESPGPMQLVLAVLFLSGVFVLAVTPRVETGILLGAFSLSFVAYGVIALRSGMQEFWFWLGIAVLARLFCFLHLPLLSDDYFRFFWDGSLLQEGLNPYGATPESLFRNGTLPPGLTEIFLDLNSPSYYSVYPPLMQLLFYAGVSLGGSLTGMVIVLRIVFILTEGLAIAGILHLSGQSVYTRNAVLLYLLNPLVIMELTGNLHFEGIYIPLVVMGIILASRNKPVISGILLSAAAAIKLVPVLVLPFAFKVLPAIQRRVFIVICMILLPLMLILPLLLFNGWTGLVSSLGLYIRTFEFNASVYYAARWIGLQILDYNPIHITGPILSVTTLIMLFVLWWRSEVRGLRSLAKTSLFAISTYLLFATTVHPWYVVSLIAMGCISGYAFPLVWSYTVVLSYCSYGINGVHENPFLVALEYGTVAGVVIYEVMILKRPLLKGIPAKEKGHQ